MINDIDRGQYVCYTKNAQKASNLHVNDIIRLMISFSSACPSDLYSYNCEEKCSTNCGNPAKCDRITGLCEGGCPIGWKTPTCKESKFLFNNILLKKSKQAFVLILCHASIMMNELLNILQSVMDVGMVKIAQRLVVPALKMNNVIS